MAQSVAQVFRSMCGLLAIPGTREDRAVIIRRDESAFTRGDKIMGIPWPAHRRPTARKTKEAKEKAERGEHTQRTDSAPPWAAETATKTSEGEKDAPAQVPTQDPDTPAVPVPPPAQEPPSQAEARSALLGVHDTAGPFAAPRDLLRRLHGGREGHAAHVAELRTVKQVVSDPRDSEEYTNWETSAHDTLSYALYSIPDQYRNVPAVKSASRIFDQIPANQLVRPDKPEPAVPRLSAVRGNEVTRRNLERLKQESVRKNQVILSARRGEDIAPRVGNTIATLCSKIGDIARWE